MDYAYAVKTDANTAKADAVETTLKLTEGTLVSVWAVHPEGCHGLAYAAIFMGGHQLYPHNADEAYHGNAVPMIWEDNLELKAPATLKLKTWNLDDTYDHTLYLRLTVLRGRVDVATQALIDALNIIKQLLTGKRLG
jgi:hypothetical protein